MGQLARQAGNTMYNARDGIQLGGAIAAGAVCVVLTGACAGAALATLVVSIVSDVYGKVACGAPGSLLGQVAVDAGLTLLTMAPAARLARVGPAAARLGRGAVGVITGL
jgi:hypothetical protein